MTRINCVPVTELSNKHLLAEYRELPRISTLSWKWADRTVQVEHFLNNLPPLWPTSYILGTGHVRFFYDKGEWLRRRFEDEIVPEMVKRGFKVSFTEYRMHPDFCNKDWMPDEAAIAINRKRIQDRLTEAETRNLK